MQVRYLLLIFREMVAHVCTVFLPCQVLGTVGSKLTVDLLILCLLASFCRLAVTCPIREQFIVSVDAS